MNQVKVLLTRFQWNDVKFGHSVFLKLRLSKVPGAMSQTSLVQLVVTLKVFKDLNMCIIVKMTKPKEPLPVTIPWATLILAESSKYYGSHSGHYMSVWRQSNFFLFLVNQVEVLIAWI